METENSDLPSAFEVVYVFSENLFEVDKLTPLFLCLAFSQRTWIQSVKLKGFKSFGLKTAFQDLNPSLSFISGPPNSGKSHILDSISYVLLSGNDSGGIRISDGEQLIFGNGETDIHKATMSLSLKSQRREAVGVITRSVVHANGIFTSSYKLNGENATEYDVKRFFDFVDFSFSSPHFLVTKETIESGLDLGILDFVIETSGFQTEVKDLQTGIDRQYEYLRQLSAEISRLDDKETYLLTENKELECIEKIYIPLEYLRLNSERLKTDMDYDSTQQRLLNLVSKEEQVVADASRAKTEKLSAEKRRQELVFKNYSYRNSLSNSQTNLEQKLDQIRRVENDCQGLEASLFRHEHKQRYLGLQRYVSYVVGDSSSSSSSGPLLANKQKIAGQANDLIASLSEEIDGATKTVSQDPKQDKLTLSAMKELLINYQNEAIKLQIKVDSNQRTTDYGWDQRVKTDADLAKMEIEMLDREATLESLKKQKNDLYRNADGLKAISASLSLDMAKLLKDHTWLKDEIEKEKFKLDVYKKVKGDYEALRNKLYGDEGNKDVRVLIAELSQVANDSMSNVIPEQMHNLEKVKCEEDLKLEEIRHAVNVSFGELVGYLLPGCTAKLVRVDGSANIHEGLDIMFEKTNGKVVKFQEMEEGQDKGVLVLSLSLALLSSCGKKLCLLDMSDTVFDESNMKERFREMLSDKVFSDMQIIVTTRNEETAVNAKTFQIRSMKTSFVVRTLGCLRKVKLVPVSARSPRKRKLSTISDTGEEHKEFTGSDSYWETTSFNELEKATAFRITKSVKDYAYKMETERISWKKQALSLVDKRNSRVVDLIVSTLQLSNLDIVASYVFRVGNKA
ncbi:probable transmembrane GTPase FZO-like protein, chloroplastic [Tanacetum coccineum]|uniref:Probable transmembrane GTPase FZO-like protein, chloroplastic n=1 Tax=Tanacetum coccineum TaxID=301880 RepID=A0ABQ5D633_9ASTR